MSTRHGFLVILLSLLGLSATCLWLAGGVDKGEDLLIQRRYADAVALLEQTLLEEPAETQDRILLLLGRARWLAGDHQGAVDAYKHLIETYPDSSRIAKARVQQAEVLATARRYREAAGLYRDEIERLVGPARKEEIAATYLGLAEKAEKREPPHYERAVTFYDLALDLGLSESKSRSVKLQAAQASLAVNDLQSAIERFTPLVAQLSRDEGKLRAMLGLGRALSKRGDRSRARTTFRDLIREASRSLEAGDAAYEIALTYSVTRRTASNLDKAVAAFTELKAKYPDHPKARIADYLIAKSYVTLGRSDPGLKALRRFVASPAVLNLPEVALARVMIGDVLAGQGKLAEAIKAWREYLSAHPSHKDWERVQRGIVDAEWSQARQKFDAGKEEYAEARKSLIDFANTHPLDVRNRMILFLQGEMLFLEDRFELAREAYGRCVSKYPNTEESSHAQYRIAEIFEKKTFNHQKALEAYKKVTWGRWVRNAKRAIAMLEKKHLALATKRSFRTGEKAGFTLTSRNIEKARIRVYRLDLETWFRATHLAGQVERLDIEVIEPDKTFESLVPEYKRYQETERRIEIGFAEAGAYVVKVDDKELEATTMVLVTDLALIAKTSRQEFLLFTQNVKDMRVASGVKVVLSDGKKIVAEGLTGADGVWRFKGKELLQNELRAFVVGPEGSGASTLQLSGLGYSQGLKPKGYLFTDRPIYQPGQAVHVKGLVREVDAGLYKLPKATDYRVRILSASGRILVQRRVDFSKFGTFGTDLVLPIEAELGTWRIQVDRVGAQVGASGSSIFTGAFEVARYELPRMSLVGKAKAPLVYRGEHILGKFELRYYYGEPAVGKTIRYVMPLPDGDRVERIGVTNAEGVVAFDFDTLEFGEEGVAVITAQVDGENTWASLTVPVVTREFEPTLSTLRAVYLTGESFDADIAIVDRSGKPLGRKGTLRLLRRDRQKGRISEVEVFSAPFRSDTKSGKVAVAVMADKGGEHVLRVESEDRFGNLVTASKRVEISGEDDKIKLRLLTDRQHFKVGEMVRVKVANRAGARLALRTIQGDGILSYEAVRIPAGESEIAVQFRAEHAPNFALALAMIADTKLHIAQRDFTVARDLSIEIVSKQEEILPGAEVELEVSAFDPQGRPVDAEVAIAVVDAAVLATRPDTLPKLSAFFYGQRRVTEFRTSSSCTWSYRGPSRPVSADLMAEERRVRETESVSGSTNTRSDEFFMGLGKRAEGSDRGRAPRPAGPSTPGPSGPSTPGPAGPTTGGPSAGGGGYRGPRQGASGSRFKDQRQELGVVRLARKFVMDGPADDMPMPSFATVQEVATDKPRSNFSELGAWLSAVRTGETGKTTVKVRMPQSTTRWEIKARAITQSTDVGEAQAELRTAKPLQADLVGPVYLTEGDSTEIEARLHNRSDSDESLALSYTERRAGAKTVNQRNLALKAGAEGSEGFPLKASSADSIEIQLSAAGKSSDAIKRTIRVLPYGVEKRVGAAGRLSEQTAFDLSLPRGREYSKLALRLEVGPDGGRDLVAAALGRGFQTARCRVIAVTNESIASRGLGALAVLAYLEKAGVVQKVDQQRLEALIESSLHTLISVQDRAGGFAWVDRNKVDRRTSSQVIRFLVGARKRGHASAEAVLDKAIAWGMRPQVSGSASRVRMARALAEAGRARFETLNTLHRQRASLSVAQLAELALAWQASKRAEMAQELVSLVQKKLKLTSSTGATDIEAVALAARALFVADPRSTLARRAITWLEQHRIGASWGTPVATSAALEAITTAGGRDLRGAGRAEIDVFVSGHKLGTVPTTVRTAITRFDVPREWVREVGNAVEIRVRGRGIAYYRATLTGFAKDFVEDDRLAEVVETDRKYLAAFKKHGNQVLKPGFSVLQGKYKRFENLVDTIGVGASCRVELSFGIRQEKDRKRWTPLVIEEPIPAGCTVPRDSIHGRFEHLVVQPDRLIFYYREGISSDRVRYELHGRFEGAFRVLPAMVYAAARPDWIAYGPERSLSVHAAGQAVDPKTYRMTPDELYQLGKALFDAGEVQAAGLPLEKLVAGWKLRDRIFREVARMLLYSSIEKQDAKGVVRYFEELKERYADLVIPFDKILAIGQSYIDIGEFEAAVLVFRATAEASFLKEAAIATTLEGMGEVKSSLRFLRGLIDSYPDLNTMRVSLYSIGQKLAEIAARMPAGARVDERVGSREALRKAAVQTLREFLVWYPEDPLAEEVSFAWATTLLEGKDLLGALQTAKAALERYPGSSLEDELLYTVGYAQFALGHSDLAFAALRRVATEDFARSRGGRGASENRKHAVYLQGQIYHALGEPEQALAAYDKVLKDFTDAGESADYFRRKDLKLAEVSSFAGDSKAELEISYRNLKSLEIKVYRVDLMRLYLLHKSLDKVRDIMLHGIKPFLTKSVELGDGRDYRDVKRKIELALDRAGAYLVVARSGDLIASGMVLRTDLVVETQESFDIGRIRVNVKRNGRFLADAHVKVVGSGDQRLRSGDSDLRGVFVADSLIGGATVIVKHGDEYGFYRGKGIHRPDRYRPQTQWKPSRRQSQKKQQKMGRQFDALENNFLLNSGNRTQRLEWLNKNVMDVKQKGVEVFRTK